MGAVTAEGASSSLVVSAIPRSSHRITPGTAIAEEPSYDYPFYPAAQGEFHLLPGRPAEATKHFETAMELASSRPQRNFFERKLKACRVGAAQISGRT